MATNPDQRIAKWDQKFNTERIKGTLDDSRARMLTNVTAVFPLITAMELEVKQVLDGEGVSMAVYSQYLCFGREVWSLQRKNVSGETLAIEAANLVTKWTNRGLDQTVLEKIRTDVFNVGSPTP